MTLGEKIRQARRGCGLSQEQLAQKLCVSRSAIAKWETDKGLPDVENLKQLAKLLGVSVDDLLDDSAPCCICREPYRLAAWGRGCKKVKKDRMMRSRFPQAKICTLLGRPQLTANDSAVGSHQGILTPGPFGAPEYLKSLRDMDRDFYLVCEDTDQFIVTVTEEFLEFHPLPQPIEEKTFCLGSWTFILLETLQEG